MARILAQALHFVCFHPFSLLLCRGSKRNSSLFPRFSRIESRHTRIRFKIRSLFSLLLRFIRLGREDLYLKIVVLAYRSRSSFVPDHFLFVIKNKKKRKSSLEILCNVAPYRENIWREIKKIIGIWFSVTFFFFLI